MNDTKNPDLQTVISAMDAVESARDRNSFLHAELDTSDREELLKNKLRATYKAQGIEISEEDLDTGVKEFTSRRFTFLPPKEKFPAKIAGLYIRRKALAKKALAATVMSVIITVTGGSTIAGVSFLKNKYERWDARKEFEEISGLQQEKAKMIQEGLQKVASLKTQKFPESNVDVIRSGTTVLESEFQRRLSQIEQDIIGQERILNSILLPEKAATEQEQIARDEPILLAAKTKLNSTLEKSPAWSQDLAKLPELITQAKSFPEILRNSEVSLNTLKRVESEVPESASDAKTLFQKLNNSIEAGKATEARNIELELKVLASDTLKMGLIPAQAESAAKMALTVSQDPAANKKITELESDAKRLAKTRKIREAEKKIDEINNIASKLEEQYEIVIYQHQGKKSGVWRYPNSNKSQKNYYLIVEALRDGNPVELTIRNEETGSTARTALWAERVTEDEYNAVRQEKEKQGRVADGLIAEKQRGKLEARYIKGVKANGAGANDTGRITTW